MGQAPVKLYNVWLRDLIIAGKIDPGAIVSHHVGIEEAPEMYHKFAERDEGYTKIVLKPNGTS